MARTTDELPPRLATDWMLMRDALAETGVSRRTFYRYRDDGIFRCKRWMNRILVSRQDVDRFLTNLESA